MPVGPESPGVLDASSTLEQIRAKYAHERDKRIRADGNDQFVEPEGDLAYLHSDPDAGPGENRTPLTDKSQVIVIGGGFGGLSVAGRLKSAGIADVRIVEKAADFGGTWYWNRYPGVQCDIESYIYLPLLEETNYMPTQKYAFGDEIRDHCQRIARHFDLYHNAVLSTEVSEVTWDDVAQEWTVHTAQGDALRAAFVVMANGPLNRPKLPGIAGIREFSGHMFHTSRWDYDYTGGSQAGQLDKIGDKRIAIVGTGATALQCVPHLAEGAAHLYVVQRTPSAVDERRNRQTDRDWAASLEPGWQQRRADNFIALWSLREEDEDLVDDLWCDLTRRLRSSVASKLRSGEATEADASVLAEWADFESMQAIRDRVDRVVNDPDTAEKLKPYYRKLCKRPAFHDEYLQTFNRNNVTLVDTNGQGVERIDASGFVVDGEHFAVDCMIFATGFEVGTAYTRRSGYDVVGENGLRLSEKWADGPKTLYGVQAADFPNLFFTGPIQGRTGINLTQTLDEQAQHVAHVIGRMSGLGATVVTVSEEAEAEWQTRIDLSGVESRHRFLGSCTPGYYNGEGDEAASGGFFSTEFGGTPLDFFELMRDWRATQDLPGLVVDGEPLPSSAADLAHRASPESILTRLAPELRRLVERRMSAGAAPMHELGIERVRALLADGARRKGPGPDVAIVEDLVIDGPGGDVPARRYAAGEDASALIVYFHGGGWATGSIDEYDAPVRRLAVRTGATVLSVGYRLAPEHPFPAANDDAWAALTFVSENRSALAAADADLYVAGDSAGANLAAVAALRARDECLPLAGQILLYPSVAGDPEAEYFNAFPSPFLVKETTQWFYNLYVPDPGQFSNPNFAPLLADTHEGLAPALIVTAEFDLLRPDGIAYAHALEQAGVSVRHVEYLGAIHAFFSVADGTNIADRVHDDVADFIGS